jgi:uncharacterized membrane protein (DUF106 family)
MVLENLLDPVLNPILQLKPVWAIILISFVLTLIITIAYKYLTNQEKLRKLKAELKEIQGKVKTLSKEAPEKAMAVQKEAMEKNLEYMKHSMRPTLFTFLPLILIFGWLNANMAYYQLSPDVPFNVTATFQDASIGYAELETTPELQFLSQKQFNVEEVNPVVWTLKGAEGKYTLDFKLNNKTQHTTNIIISTTREYEPPKINVKDSLLKYIEISNKPIHPFGNVSIFGWHPGWLGTYIILSLVFSTLLRRLMKIV